MYHLLLAMFRCDEILGVAPLHFVNKKAMDMNLVKEFLRTFMENGKNVCHINFSIIFELLLLYRFIILLYYCLLFLIFLIFIF